MPTREEHNMTLNELITIAAATYPDGLILQYWDSIRQKPRKNANAGDTLAMFIVQELTDTFDPAATDAEQVATASQAIERAAAELIGVTAAIRKRGKG